MFAIGNTSFEPTSFTISAPGWTVTPLAVSPSAAIFGAVAPATLDGTFTVSSSPARAWFVMADEFTGNDPNGGTTTFDRAIAVDCPTGCATSLTTGHRGDTLWVAMTQGVVDLAPGFTPDTEQMFAAYRFTNDPPSSIEPITLGAASSGYTVTAVSITPR